MKINVEVESVRVNVPRIVDKVRSEKMWRYAAVQWHKLYTPYVPFDTGTLTRDVAFSSNPGIGIIDHNAPYARYVYNGHFRFRKDQHPLATRQWDKAAAKTQLRALERSIQAYVDSGRLGLDK